VKRREDDNIPYTLNTPLDHEEDTEDDATRDTEMMEQAGKLMRRIMFVYFM
jgi:hypothetical protein